MNVDGLFPNRMIIPPGNPYDHFRGMPPMLPMARGGVRTIGSTVNTLGQLMMSGGKRKGKKSRRC